MLYLKTENIFENFGRGKIARLRLSSLCELLARLVSVTLKQELQTSGISSNTVNKIMLVFANFFTAKAHYAQSGQLDLYFDTTTGNLLKLEHRTQALQNWAVELRKLATANKALYLDSIWMRADDAYIVGEIYTL